jgi:hypothetical protein
MAWLLFSLISFGFVGYFVYEAPEFEEEIEIPVE